MCSKAVRLRAQNLITILGSTFDIIGGGRGDLFEPIHLIMIMVIHGEWQCMGASFQKEGFMVSPWGGGGRGNGGAIGAYWRSSFLLM